MDFENVKKAIKALQEGKIILVTDDEDRENDNGECEFYCYLCERIDLYTDEPGNCTEAYV